MKALEALEKTGARLYSPYRDGEIVHFGFSQYFNKSTGEIFVSDPALVAKVKQAYAAEIVKQQAKKFGWTLKETAPFQYQVTKR